MKRTILPAPASGFFPAARAPRAPRLPEGWGVARLVDSPEVTIHPEDGATCRPPQRNAKESHV